MLNEYLFLSDENRAAVEGYKPPTGVKFDKSEVNETSWIASFSIKGDNNTNATKLSEVHSAISEYSPLVLMCESSRYYNKMLYPLVNELERKLRNLLYSFLPFSTNENAKENIKDLESKKMFDLFNMLFIDDDFIKKIKSRVNADKNSEYQGLGQFTKSEIQSFVNSIEENAFWDKYFGTEYAPTLRERFSEVRVYRNKVMHAHNMDDDEFNDAKGLFSTVNKELDDAIEELRRSKDDKAMERKKHVGAALAEILEFTRAFNTGIEDLTPRLASVAQNAHHENMRSKIIAVYDEVINQMLAVERLIELVSEAVNTPASEMTEGFPTQDLSSKIARNLEIIQPNKIVEELAQSVLSATNFDYLISPGLQRYLDNFEIVKGRLTLLLQAAGLTHCTFPSDDDNEINELLDDPEEDDSTEPS